MLTQDLHSIKDDIKFLHPCFKSRLSIFQVVTEITDLR